MRFPIPCGADGSVGVLASAVSNTNNRPEIACVSAVGLEVRLVKATVMVLAAVVMVTEKISGRPAKVEPAGVK